MKNNIKVYLLKRMSISAFIGIVLCTGITQYINSGITGNIINGVHDKNVSGASISTGTIQDSINVENIDSNGREIKAITDESEIINTIGVKWGASGTEVKYNLEGRQFTVGDVSEDGYSLLVILDMMGKSWAGNLEFNDYNELFGFSQRLIEPIQGKEEIELYINNIIESLNNKYGTPITDGTNNKTFNINRYKEEVCTSLNNIYVVPVLFEGHDVTCLCTFLKVDKSREDLYEIYERAGIDSDVLSNLKSDEDYYTIYIAYISDNYSSDKNGINIEYSDNLRSISDITPLSYYEDSTGKLIVLNCQEYENFDPSVDLSKYYTNVDWTTSDKDSKGRYLISLADMKKLIDKGEKSPEDFGFYYTNY